MSYLISNYFGGKEWIILKSTLNKKNELNLGVNHKLIKYVKKIMFIMIFPLLHSSRSDTTKSMLNAIDNET